MLKLNEYRTGTVFQHEKSMTVIFFYEKEKRVLRLTPAFARQS